MFPYLQEKWENPSILTTGKIDNEKTVSNSVIVNLKIWEIGPQNDEQEQTLFTKRPAADSKESSTKCHPHVRSKTSADDFPTLGSFDSNTSPNIHQKHGALGPQNHEKWRF